MERDCARVQVSPCSHEAVSSRNELAITLLNYHDKPLMCETAENIQKIVNQTPRENASVSGDGRFAGRF